MSDLLPCPFCGRSPVVQRGKKGHCQMHGNPFQGVVVMCKTPSCANPRFERGDIFSGGEVKARQKAIAAWNRRTPPDEVDALRAELAAVREALKPFAAIADEVWQSAPDDQTLTDIGMDDEVTVGMCRAARAALGDPA